MDNDDTGFVIADDVASGAFAKKTANAIKFINLVGNRDVEKIAGVRPVHFAGADRVWEQGNLAIGGCVLAVKGIVF